MRMCVQICPPSGGGGTPLLSWLWAPLLASLQLTIENVHLYFENLQARAAVLRPDLKVCVNFTDFAHQQLISLIVPHDFASIIITSGEAGRDRRAPAQARRRRSWRDH